MKYNDYDECIKALIFLLGIAIFVPQIMAAFAGASYARDTRYDNECVTVNTTTPCFKEGLCALQECHRTHCTAAPKSIFGALLWPGFVIGCSGTKKRWGRDQ